MRWLLSGVGLLLLPASTCFGALQLITTNGALQGYGIGAQTTLLDLSNPKGSPLVGCVGYGTVFGGTTAGDIYGTALSSSTQGCVAQDPKDLKDIQSSSQTATFQELNITSVSDLYKLGVVYNTNQSANGPITLFSIVLTIYDDSGNVLWYSQGQLQANDPAHTPSSSLKIGDSVETPPGGIGRGDAVFMIVDNQQFAANTLTAKFGGATLLDGSNRIGVYLETGCATASDTCFVNNDGSEVISLTRVTPVPEPGAWTAVTGLVLMFAARKWIRVRS